MNADLANSTKLEESTAAPNRPPAYIKGLTTFLRQAYYEKKGIYISKARGEHAYLKEFWKNEVSESYQQHRVKALTQRQANNTMSFGAPVAAVPQVKHVETKFDI